MAKNHPERPRDPNQLAKLIVDIATGQTKESAPEQPTPAQEFARTGGLKGAAARATKLTPQRRREIARIAAKSRWGAPKDKK